MNVVMKTTLRLPPVCRREVLRYAGCREETAETAALLDLCLAEAEPLLTGRVCWLELPLTVEEDRCAFGDAVFFSRDLAKNLSGCHGGVLFAATVGAGIDRLLARYSVTSPARAVLLQALGAERVEALCDAFCSRLEAETGMGLRPRFSPGYGDLPLAAQKQIFALLEPMRHIGLSLTESLLMSPTKSVTAFVGLTEGKTKKVSKCALCDKKDCVFRGESGCS